LERPHALDDGYTSTEVGHLFVLTDWPNTPGIKYYLQGLPVFLANTSRWGTEDLIVHLDSKQFKARVPDRDQLYDGSDCEAKVRGAYNEKHYEYFEYLSKTIAPYSFMKHYKQLRSLGFRYRHLFDALPYLPTAVVQEVGMGVPVMEFKENWGDEWLANTKYPISKKDIEEGKFILVDLQDDSDMEYNGALLETWLYLSTTETERADSETPAYLVYKGGLTEDHWVQNLPKNQLFSYEDIECEIVPDQVTATAEFSSNVIDATVKFCKGYTIKVKFVGELKDGEEAPEFTEVYNMDTPVWGGNVYYVPSDCTNWGSVQAIGQLSKFYSEVYGDYSEEIENKQKDKFCSFVANNRNSDPVEVLKSLLQGINFQSFPLIKDKQFVLTISDRGNPTYSLMESNNG
jgi:hypothetical protein